MSVVLIVSSNSQQGNKQAYFQINVFCLSWTRWDNTWTVQVGSGPGSGTNTPIHTVNKQTWSRDRCTDLVMLILYQTVSVAFLQREEEIRLNVSAFINTFLFLHILPRLSLSPVLSFTLFSSQATRYHMTLSLQNESRVVFLKIVTPSSEKWLIASN